MKDRLQQILKNEKLTPARFAELVGVQRSSVSHILSGRNNPSLDFLQKILANFEHINPDWLITGNGTYKRPSGENKNIGADESTRREGKIVFPENGPVKEEERAEYGKKPKSDSNLYKNHLSSYNQREVVPASENKAPTTTRSEKTIIKTILFYDDNSFEVFFPV
jgi:transcriptional regulator with XRE-family HTH domain